MTINRGDLHTLDFTDISTGVPIPLSTPGDILRLDVLEPSGLSAYALARAIGVPLTRIMAILHGRRGITADTALRLAAHANSAEFWMNLQVQYDLEMARGARAA